MELLIKLFKGYLVTCFIMGIIIMISIIYTSIAFNQDINEVLKTFSIISACTLLSGLMLFVTELIERV